MTWYEAYYNTEPGLIKYVARSFKRKEVFEAARRAANLLRVTVTISADRGSAFGIYSKYYEVKPE